MREILSGNCIRLNRDWQLLTSALINRSSDFSLRGEIVTCWKFNRSFRDLVQVARITRATRALRTGHSPLANIDRSGGIYVGYIGNPQLCCVLQLSNSRVTPNRESRHSVSPSTWETLNRELKAQPPLRNIKDECEYRCRSIFSCLLLASLLMILSTKRIFLIE